MFGWQLPPHWVNTLQSSLLHESFKNTKHLSESELKYYIVCDEEHNVIREPKQDSAAESIKSKGGES